jgi:hypothetical protein
MLERPGRRHLIGWSDILEAPQRMAGGGRVNCCLYAL